MLIAHATIAFALFLLVPAGAGAVVLAPGDVLVLTEAIECPFPSGNALVRIDPVTGDRTIISGREEDCSDVGAGPQFLDAENIAFEPGGDVLVADSRGMRVLRVDPATGDRSVLSGCLEPDNTGTCPSEVRGTGRAIPDPEGIAVVSAPAPAVSGLPLLGGVVLVGLMVVLGWKRQRDG